MLIDNLLLDELFANAANSPRLRQNFDLRTSEEDTSQRMINALLPETQVTIHRHENTSETVVCLCGRLEEIIFKKQSDGTYQEICRELLCPAEGRYGIQIPAGAWHSIHVIEPSVIFEAKDGAYQS